MNIEMKTLIFTDGSRCIVSPQRCRISDGSLAGNDRADRGIRHDSGEARENNEAAARAFYKALGYRETQVLRGYYEGRDDAVVLKKTMHS